MLKYHRISWSTPSPGLSPGWWWFLTSLLSFISVVCGDCGGESGGVEPTCLAGWSNVLAPSPCWDWERGEGGGSTWSSSHSDISSPSHFTHQTKPDTRLHHPALPCPALPCPALPSIKLGNIRIITFRFERFSLQWREDRRIFPLPIKL